MSDKVERRVDNIEKSIGDSRIYRGLVLKNGLTALLISDPDTDKSAASLSVAVGKGDFETYTTFIIRFYLLFK